MNSKHASPTIISEYTPRTIHLLLDLRLSDELHRGRQDSACKQSRQNVQDRTRKVP